MNKPFLLLKLPQLPLLRVLKLFDTIELIDISICSKISKHLARLTIEKPQNVNFLVDNAFNISIRFEKYEISIILYADTLAENRNKIPFSGSVQIEKWCKLSYRKMKESYEMKNFGIRKWLDHLLDVFKLRVLYEMEIRDPVNDFSVFEVKNLLNGLKIDNVRIGSFIDNSIVHAILNAIEISKKLCLPDIASSKNLKLNMDELKIQMKSKFHIEHLLECNCRIVDLGYSNIKDNEMNEFLKNWKNGSNEKLELLVLRNEEKVWNMNVLLDGLNGIEVEEPRSFHLNSSNTNEPGREMTIQNSIDILRVDKKASIILRQFEDESNFMLLVWSRN